MGVTNFQFVTDLHLTRLRAGTAKLFYVARPYLVIFYVDGRRHEYVVPADTPTDFASIPRLVPRWVIDKLGPHIEAAVVHDRMCIDRGPFSSAVAADIFVAGMIAGGVGIVTRQVMYRAVKWFGPRWT